MPPFWKKNLQWQVWSKISMFVQKYNKVSDRHTTGKLSCLFISAIGFISLFIWMISWFLFALRILAKGLILVCAIFKFCYSDENVGSLIIFLLTTTVFFYFLLQSCISLSSHLSCCTLCFLCIFLSLMLLSLWILEPVFRPCIFRILFWSCYSVLLCQFLDKTFM